MRFRRVDGVDAPWGDEVVLRRGVRTIAVAAAAVAAVRRLEVRAGAPRAAVPIVAGCTKTIRHARVVGRSSRRESRPQQQNRYDRDAGRWVGHGVLRTMNNNLAIWVAIF